MNDKYVNNFLSAHPDIDLFEVLLPDLNGCLRGKWLSRDHIHDLFENGLKMPLTTLGFDVWGRDPESWVFVEGDRDGVCVAEPRSLVSIPWLSKPTAQVLMSLRTELGHPCGYDPRDLVRAIQQRFGVLGIIPVVALEMEFYLLDANRDDFGKPVHSQKGIDGRAALGGQTYGIEQMQDVAPVMYAIRDACELQNLPIDTLITESAPSQYEINLYHQADALLAADQALMLKRLIKRVAKQQGYLATFMAKPFADQAGSGMHLHVSLNDNDGHNLFASSGDREANKLLRQAIAGCLNAMPDSMAIFSPSFNAFRRFQQGSHAPLAASWGYENRTTALRIPAGSNIDRRIEHRVASADANPYLVVASILGAMLYGVENQLEAPPDIVGDAYEQGLPGLPRYLPDALNTFEQSSYIQDCFGSEFQRVFLAAKRQELAEFDRQVTLLEYDSYL